MNLLERLVGRRAIPVQRKEKTAQLEHGDEVRIEEFLKNPVLLGALTVLKQESGKEDFEYLIREKRKRFSTVANRVDIIAFWDTKGKYSFSDDWVYEGPGIALKISDGSLAIEGDNSVCMSWKEVQKSPETFLERVRNAYANPGEVFGVIYAPRYSDEFDTKPEGNIYFSR